MTGYTLIAAVDQNNIIGNNGALPWPKIPADLDHFKETTRGGVLAMGSGTMKSIGRVLPHRVNIVITRRDAPHSPYSDCFCAGSPHEALDLWKERWPERPLFVIGGEQIYGQTIDGASTLIITHIEAAFTGDRRFPAINPNVWRVAREQRIQPGKDTPFLLRIREYRRHEQP